MNIDDLKKENLELKLIIKRQKEEIRKIVRETNLLRKNFRKEINSVIRKYLSDKNDHSFRKIKDKCIKDD